MDKGQRIKNWESKTSGIVKRLTLAVALVLSGTPLENRLDDLYSVVQFVNDRRLGPGFRFFNKHRVVDEKGRCSAIRILAIFAKRSKPILLRRTRESVQLELPPRTTEIVRIARPRNNRDAPVPHADCGHDRSQEVHQRDGLAAIAKGTARLPDVGRRHIAGQQEKPNYSTKLEYLDELFESACSKKTVQGVSFGMDDDARSDSAAAAKRNSTSFG